MTSGFPTKAPPMVSSSRRINSSACVITPENYPSRISRPGSARRREAALEAGEAMTELPARARGRARALRALDRLEDHPAGGGEVAPPVLGELRELPPPPRGERGGAGGPPPAPARRRPAPAAPL